MKRIGVVAILLFAFLGLADSMYLAQHSITGTPLICDIKNFDGCNIVANSSYAYLFGVPLSEYGVLLYSILFVLAALELVLFDQLLRRVLQGISLFALLMSLYFVSVQIFFIGAFCIYCTASALITLLIFIFATRIEPIRKGNWLTKPPVGNSPHLPMPPTA